MPRTTPDQATAKWVSHIGAATQAITDGVNRVTTAPGAKAAAQKNYWLSRTQNAADKWARNVGRVSLASWQTSMTQYGIQRIAGGAQAKQQKYHDFAAQFFPYVDQGAQKVKAMPKNNLQDSIARAAAMITHNAGFKRGG